MSDTQKISLPNEIWFKIYSKMDIDTRRKLGIYVKLKVPDKLTNLLDYVNNTKIVKSVLIAPDDAEAEFRLSLFENRLKSDIFVRKQAREMLKMNIILTTAITTGFIYTLNYPH